MSKSYVEDLVSEVHNTVHHGECFHDEEDFNNFLELLVRLRESSVALFINNQLGN